MCKLPILCYYYVSVLTYLLSLCIIQTKRGDRMNRIKMLREEKEISMRQAAADLGIPYTTYVNYEKGVREPNSEMLVTLANYFAVSIDFLIGRTENRKTNETGAYAEYGFLPPPATVRKPRLGRISCGKPIDSIVCL